MAHNLAVGKEFKSFEALQDAVHQYEQQCFAQLSRTDSRTIENEESRRSSKLFNPDIKYSFVTFTCAFGGKPYVSRSTGIRNSKPRIKCNCPVTLKCYASADGQKLVIRQSELDTHNHECSEESFKSLPRGKLLDEETEQEIYDLIQSHENKKLARKLVKEKLVAETGRDITYKDIQNIEKRMSKKNNQSEKNGRSEEDDCSDASMPSDHEEEEETEEDSKKDNSADSQLGNGAENNEVSNENKDKSSKGKNTPKKRANTATPRPVGRPRRAIREPTRFRDPSVTVSSSVLKRRASESDNSWEGSDSEAVVKKEPQSTGKRGRPPKAQKREKAEAEEGGSVGESSDAEQSSHRVTKVDSFRNKSDSLMTRQLEMEERRLKIQEEMLNLQRQSMLLLQNVVTKLDRVEANQKGEAASMSGTVQREMLDFAKDESEVVVSKEESGTVISKEESGTVISKEESDSAVSKNDSVTVLTTVKSVAGDGMNVVNSSENPVVQTSDSGDH